MLLRGGLIFCRLRVMTNLVNWHYLDGRLDACYRRGDFPVAKRSCPPALPALMHIHRTVKDLLGRVCGVLSCVVSS